MQAKVKRLLVLLVGWSLIVLGVIGLFLPVLQGVLFLLIGLFVLSSEYAWARRIRHKALSRYPSMASRSDEAARRAHDVLARLFGPQPGTVRREASKEDQATTHDSESKVEAAGAPAGPWRDVAGTFFKPSSVAQQAVKIGSLDSDVAKGPPVTVSGGVSKPNKANGCAERCGTR